MMTGNPKDMLMEIGETGEMMTGNPKDMTMEIGVTGEMMTGNPKDMMMEIGAAGVMMTGNPKDVAEENSSKKEKKEKVTAKVKRMMTSKENGTLTLTTSKENGEPKEIKKEKERRRWRK